LGGAKLYRGLRCAVRRRRFVIGFLEVAAMTAICAACDITLDGLEVARLCQRVENEIVGAPCGIMDQVTVALGRENELLQLLCQPHQVLPFVTLPPDVEIFGINSNVKHSVGGGAYGQARCATFMGRRILRDMVPQAMRGADGELYLANLSPDVWRALRLNIPEKMWGRDFLARYESHDDAATTLNRKSSTHCASPRSIPFTKPTACGVLSRCCAQLKRTTRPVASC
jgi:L-arabinokinase